MARLMFEQRSFFNTVSKKFIEGILKWSAYSKKTFEYRIRYKMRSKRQEL